MPLSKDVYTTSNDFSPILSIKSVTFSDAADLPDGTCRALIFTASGNICFDTANGETVTLSIGAQWFGVTYIRAKRIRATNTTVTAGSVFACY
jgi:hypothetical protein